MVTNNESHGSLGNSNSNSNSMTNDVFLNRSELKILLCDSDPESCEEVSALLTECSYEVICVSSVLEAVDVLNTERPYVDILLLGVDAHIDNGMKMLQYVNEEFRHIPAIIMLSRQDHTSLIYKYLKVGAAGYLVKPFCPEELSSLWMYKWSVNGDRDASTGMALQVASTASESHMNIAFGP